MCSVLSHSHKIQNMLAHVTMRGLMTFYYDEMCCHKCNTSESQTQTNVYCSLSLGMKYLSLFLVEGCSLINLVVCVRVVHSAICELDMQKLLCNSLKILSRCHPLLASHVNHICNKKFVTTKTTLHYLKMIH